MKLISVVTPCYNEEENVEEVYRQVKQVIESIGKYEYEHIFIDNSSTDRTVAVIKEIAKIDKNVKLIVNTRNFGWVRSHHHGLLQARGDAVILQVADMQDPPALIKDFIEKWEQGYKVVLGIKSSSEETKVMYSLRTLFYNTINRISEIELSKNNTGFGLYDSRVMEIIREIEDPYPYFRGLVSDLGFETAKIEYSQKSRVRGLSKSNFYKLYDLGMLGITNHSKVPLRLATISGFFMSFFCLLIAVAYFLYKIIFWNSFSLGVAPLVIGLFLFASVQLFFIGVLGEYIGSIYTQVQKRPLVIEKERINFNKDNVIEQDQFKKKKSEIA